MVSDLTSHAELHDSVSVTCLHCQLQMPYLCPDPSPAVWEYVVGAVSAVLNIALVAIVRSMQFQAETEMIIRVNCLVDLVCTFWRALIQLVSVPPWSLWL